MNAKLVSHSMVRTVDDQGIEKVVGNAAGDDANIDLDLNGDGAILPDGFSDGIPRPDDRLTIAVSSAEGWSLAYAAGDLSAVEGFLAR